MTASISRYRQQTGSVLVQFALLLGIIVAILGVLDIGYMYYAKRELQRTADLAALSAVNAIEFDKSSTAQRALPCKLAGVKNVKVNWGDSSPIVPFMLIEDSVICGEWNTGLYDGPEYFSDSASEINAARVELKGISPTFIPGPWSREITARAVAERGEPQAEFSVSSALLKLGCTPISVEASLVQVLKLIGVGDPCVTLNSYKGLAKVEPITASGLLKELGLSVDTNLSVLDTNSFLAAQKVSLGELLDAVVIVGGGGQFLSANTALLKTLSSHLSIDSFSLEVPLGTGTDGPGVLAVLDSASGSSASALDVKLNALDVISTAVAIGTSRRGIEIQKLTVNIPFLFSDVLKVKAGITEPPSIGRGSKNATAYNAQVRLAVEVDTTKGMLGGLLKLLGTQIKIPIFIDLSRAKATMKEVFCADSTADIEVESSIAQICIGKSLGDPFSISTPICETIEKETLVSALGLVKVHNKIKLDILGSNKTIKNFKKGIPELVDNGFQKEKSLSEPLRELTRFLSELIESPPSSDGVPAESEESSKKIANYYLGIGPEKHADGGIPKNERLGVPVLLGIRLGPSGIYNVSILKNRLKKDIDINDKTCLLLPILCWTTSEWDDWAEDIESNNSSSKRACWGETPEGRIKVGLSADASDVIKFNQCVQRELKEAMFETPQKNQPKYLQFLLTQIGLLLELILNSLSSFLENELRKKLGIELGVNEVELRELTCDRGRLVY